MNSARRFVLPFLYLLCASTFPVHAQVSPDHKTRHIIFVMTDGLRWQEVFHGAEASLRLTERRE